MFIGRADKRDWISRVPSWHYQGSMVLKLRPWMIKSAPAPPVTPSVFMFFRVLAVGVLPRSSSLRLRGELLSLEEQANRTKPTCGVATSFVMFVSLPKPCSVEHGPSLFWSNWLDGKRSFFALFSYLGIRSCASLALATADLC